MTTLPWLIACLPLVVMGGMGLISLFNPQWGADLVRLLPSVEKPGGFAEFRATFGGLFFGSHAIALLLVISFLTQRRDLLAVIASGALITLGAAYAGSAFGRALSVWRDGTRTGFNLGSIAFEAGCTLCLWAPWIAGMA